MSRYLKKYLYLSVAFLTVLSAGCSQTGDGKTFAGKETRNEYSETLEEPKATADSESTEVPKDAEDLKSGEIPQYAGMPYTEVNGNCPEFADEDKTEESFETYSELDSLGRCGEAYANIGQELMPVKERGAIGQVKPTGWHTVKYDFVDGKYLYNRCHLIGYQLTAENSNVKNLITGTRYMNIGAMLEFENMVADYVRETGNHVLYRVTPVFKGKNLLADGVKMEGYSVEDDGRGIYFNVFVYNVQPGVVIDYETGESAPDESYHAYAYDSGNESFAENDGHVQGGAVEIRGNRNSKIYHCPGQAYYDMMAESPNLIIFYSEEDAGKAGYRKAKR